MIAADRDTNIAAVVAVSPKQSIVDVLASSLGPKQAWLSFMRPLCKWTFELAYQVETTDLDISRYSKLGETRPVLITEPLSITELGTKHTMEICQFLDAKLPPLATASAKD